MIMLINVTINLKKNYINKWGNENSQVLIEIRDPIDGIPLKAKYRMVPKKNKVICIQNKMKNFTNSVTSWRVCPRRAGQGRALPLTANWRAPCPSLTGGAYMVAVHLPQSVSRPFDGLQDIFSIISTI